jgi:Dyp-type peroxidase family
MPPTAQAHQPGNEFLIRPIEISEERFRYDLTLAPPEDAETDLSLLPKQHKVRVTATVPGKGQIHDDVTLERVEGNLRDIDLAAEAEKALDPQTVTGVVVPPYAYLTQWPSGKARITHLAANQELKWGKKLERGAEVRIDFPVRIRKGRAAGSGTAPKTSNQLFVYIPALQTDGQAMAAGASKAKVDEDLPLRSSEDVQGNILGGFNKPYQVFLFLRFDPDRQKARRWLGVLAGSDGKSKPLVTDTKQVTDFKERLRRGREDKDSAAEYLRATWLNVSLTHSGITALRPDLAADLEGFQAFRDGPAKRAKDLGDEGENHPDRWIVGNGVDALVTVAADDLADLRQAVNQQRPLAAEHSVALVYEQRGDALPGGREHFGFRDGVSQPGVEGYSRQRKGPAGPEDADHPGASIVAADQFLLDSKVDWLQGATFQVWRRLTQDVAGWRAQLRYLSQSTAREERIDPDLLAAKLVGRWPSGTPTAIAPFTDDQPDKSVEDNVFDFENDAKGERTPMSAHVRRLNPRKPKAGTPRLLRRGIPFGPAYDPAKPEDEYEPFGARERGLCFNAFMASIEDQFEALQQRALPAQGAEPDSLVGGEHARKLHLPGRKPRTLNLRSYVRTSGAVYALAPTLPGLRILATDPQQS